MLELQIQRSIFKFFKNEHADNTDKKEEIEKYERERERERERGERDRKKIIIYSSFKRKRIHKTIYRNITGTRE